MVDSHLIGRTGGDYCKGPAEVAAVCLLVIDVVVDPSTGVYIVVVVAVVVERRNMRVAEEHDTGIAMGLVDFELQACLGLDVISPECSECCFNETGLLLNTVRLLTGIPRPLIVWKQNRCRNLALFIEDRKHILDGVHIVVPIDADIEQRITECIAQGNTAELRSKSPVIGISGKLVGIRRSVWNC
ncbi:hypothetical protein SDC9_136614 [bioreactor metagenome]|uniref:Uncharacterized protein n=1 Tax=bioreactor metagenome TaxID=1076179 RepID=A0A645DJR4_9ZZZZ